MHSSSVLNVDDVCTADASTRSPCSFDALCPAYSPRDRMAIVCDASAYGPLHVGRTVLAFTAAFYAPLRAQDAPFFDYPHHFVLLTGVDDQATLPEAAMRCWTHMDVWPASQWIALSSDRAEVLNALCSLQINRLLWPAGMRFDPPADTLPPHVYKLLNTRLSQIMIYGPEQEHTDWKLALSGASDALWREALERCGAAAPYPEADQLCHRTVDAFLQQHADVFTTP